MKNKILLRLGLLVTALMCGMAANAQNDITNDSIKSKSIDSSIPKEVDGVKIFDVVEKPPQFPGGQKKLLEFLANTIVYPPVAEENGIQGRVVVEFIVEMDGSISNVKVVRSVDPSLDKEAVRVAKCMPKWIPGKQQGKPVRVKYNLPVTFRLDGLEPSMPTNNIGNMGVKPVIGKRNVDNMTANKSEKITKCLLEAFTGLNNVTVDHYKDAIKFLNETPNGNDEIVFQPGSHAPDDYVSMIKKELFDSNDWQLFEKALCHSLGDNIYNSAVNLYLQSRAKSTIGRMPSKEQWLSRFSLPNYRAIFTNLLYNDDSFSGPRINKGDMNLVKLMIANSAKGYKDKEEQKKTDVLSNNETNEYKNVAEALLKQKGLIKESLRLDISHSCDELVVFSDMFNNCFVMVANKKYAKILNDNLVLAYSTESTMNQTDKIVTLYITLLKSLADNIDNNMPENSNIKTASASPLLGSICWSQDMPYNALLPKGNDGKKMIAGPGAVALAHIMRYYKYPQKPKGSHYYLTSKGQKMGADFSKYSFDWSQTNDSFEEDDTLSLASQVVGACALALETEGHGGMTTSCTLMRFFKSALVNFFGYQRNCRYLESLSCNGVMNILYKEIDAKRPVLCMGVGNFFVCDGYDNDFFHLNMGWGGYANGYYRMSLSRMVPDSTPFIEKMIVGISPELSGRNVKEVALSKPGTLSQLLSDEEKKDITHLKIVGKLNGLDMSLIRRMAGCDFGVRSMDWIGKLELLDLSQAQFVTDKDHPFYRNNPLGKEIVRTKVVDGHIPLFPNRYDLVNISESEWNTIKNSKLLKGKGYKYIKNENEKGTHVDFTTYKGIVSPSLFEQCENLKYIILPQKTKEICEEAFHGCISLDYLVLPSSVKKVAEGVFANCYTLKYVYTKGKTPKTTGRVSMVQLGDFRTKLIDAGVFMGCNKANCLGYKIESNPPNPWDE